MKTFSRFLVLNVIIVAGFFSQSFAQIKSPSSKKYFEAFPVIMSPMGMAQKIDWSQKSDQNQKALAYKDTFEEAVADFRYKITKGDVAVFAGKFLVIPIACGTECIAIGLYNVMTGVPVLLNKVASLGVSYNGASRLLVIDPPEVIQEVYKTQVPHWLKTEYFVISDAGDPIRFNPY